MTLVAVYLIYMVMLGERLEENGMLLDIQATDGVRIKMYRSLFILELFHNEIFDLLNKTQ